MLLGHRESGDEPVIWRPSIRANPHLMILGQPGMGKTTTLITVCLQLQVHGTQNEHLQRAFATFVLYNLYQGMFRRGPQGRITHAVMFDEAHRAARLKLIPTMVKECRKYGIAFVVASQEAKDFDPSLFTAVANYLALRLSEADAKLMAKNFAVADKVALYTDCIKQMPKYQAMYYGEGLRTPIRVALAQYRNPDRTAK